MELFFIISWLALIMTVSSISEVRQNRDLLFIEKFMKSLLGIPRSLHHEDSTSFYKIPGMGNFVIKAAPKYNIKEKEISVPKKYILGRKNLETPYYKLYSRTNAMNEPTGAIDQANHLVNLHLLNENKNQNIPEPTVSFIPNSNNNAKKEINKINSMISPISTSIKKSDYSSYFKILNIDAVTVRKPVPIEVPNPTNVRVTEIYSPKYSYKQTAQDGSITTFKSEHNQNIIITETETLPAIPLYIKSRLKEVAEKCATNICCIRAPSNNVPIITAGYSSLGIPVPNLIGLSKFTITPDTPPLLVHTNDNLNVIPNIAQKLPPYSVSKTYNKSGNVFGQDIDGPVVIRKGPPIMQKRVTVLTNERSKGVNVNVQTMEIDKVRDNNSFNLSDQREQNLTNNRFTNTTVIENSNNTSITTVPDHIDNRGSYLNRNTNYQATNEQSDSKNTVPILEETKTKSVDDLKNDGITLHEYYDVIPSNYLYVPPIIKNLPTVSLNTKTRNDTKETDSRSSLGYIAKNNLKQVTRIASDKAIVYSLKDKPIIVPADSLYINNEMERDGTSTIIEGIVQNNLFENEINKINDNILDVLY